MARTDTGAQLTRQHRQRQLTLRAAVLREFMDIWPVWNPGDPRSFDSLVAATVPLVELRRRTSAGLASDYYRAFRTAEGVGGETAPRLAHPAPREQVITSLYVTGQVQARRAVAAGMSPQAARQNTLVTLTGAVSRHVLDGGRQTIVRSSVADEGAMGWTRVTGSDPCSFCAMLATRGPVYSEQSAAPPDEDGRRVPQVIGRRGGRTRGARQVGESYHDNCACSLEPFYEGASLPPETERFRQLWSESTRGLTGNDALNAFRQALGTH
jgi:hypothetical protein